MDNQLELPTDTAHLTGSIAVVTEEENTLDEPIKETLKRDAKAVFSKFGHVLIPRRNKLLLQDCTSTRKIPLTLKGICGALSF